MFDRISVFTSHNSCLWQSSLAHRSLAGYAFSDRCCSIFYKYPAMQCIILYSWESKNSECNDCNVILKIPTQIPMKSNCKRRHV